MAARVARKESGGVEPIPRLRRFSMYCRMRMGWAAKGWLCCYLAFIFMSLIGVQLAPFNYWILNALVLAFILAAVGRLACCSAFVLGYGDVRAKDEQYFIPAHVPLGFAQRLYMAARLVLFDGIASIVASGLLLISNNGPAAYAPFYRGGVGLLLAASLATLLALLAAAVLLHLHTFGCIVIYDPSEHLNIAKPAPETDALDGHSPGLLRTLMLTRRAPMLCLLMLFPAWCLGVVCGDVLGYSRLADGIKYACAGLAGLAALYALVRLAIVATVFARYTMVHVLGTQLLLGFLISLCMILPPGWNLLPFFAALMGAFLVFYYVSMQDPEGAKYTPEFIRRQRRVKRRERLAAQERQQKEVGKAEAHS